MQLPYIFSLIGYQIQTQDSQEGLSLYQLSNPDGSPRWIWPAGQRNPLFLRFYNKQSTKAKLQAFLLGLLCKSGLVGLIARRIQIQVTENHLPYKAFDPTACQWALFTGTPGPRRKAIFLVEESGSRRFVKVPLGEQAAEALETEARFLASPASNGLSGTLPALLLHTRSFVQYTALPEGKRSGKLEASHLRFFGSLSRNRKETTFGTSTWVADQLLVLDRLEQQRDSRIPSGLLRKLRHFAQNFPAQTRIQTHFSHGDFTPWNVYVYENEVAVYDWENVCAERPAGFDAFHFILQQGILVHRRSWTELVTELENTLAGLPLPGLSQEDFTTSAQLYLWGNTLQHLDLFSRQAIWHTQVSWLLETWSLGLSQLMADMQEPRALLAMDLADQLSTGAYAYLKLGVEFPELLAETSDLDVLLPAHRNREITHFLQAHPLTEQVKSRQENARFAISCQLKNGSLLFVDLLEDFRWKGYQLESGQAVLERAEKDVHGFVRVSPADEARFVAWFYGLNQAAVPARYAEGKNLLSSSFQMEDQLLSRVFDSEEGKMQKSLLHLLKQKMVNQGIKGLAQQILYQAFALRSLLQGGGMIVTFSGVDGAGKSTLISEVKHRLEKVHRRRVVVIRHRPSLLPILSAWTKGKAQAEAEASQKLPRQGQNQSTFSSLLRFGYYYADYLIGQFVVQVRYVWRGYVVLYDRYYFDFINDSRRSNLALPTWFTRLGYSLLVTPDLNLFLYADAQTILERKKELDAQTIEELTRAYLNLFERLQKGQKRTAYLSIRNEQLEKTLEQVFNQIALAA